MLQILVRPDTPQAGPELQEGPSGPMTAFSNALYQGMRSVPESLPSPAPFLTKLKRGAPREGQCRFSFPPVCCLLPLGRRGRRRSTGRSSVCIASLAGPHRSWRPTCPVLALRVPHAEVGQAVRSLIFCALAFSLHVAPRRGGPGGQHACAHGLPHAHLHQQRRRQRAGEAPARRRGASAAHLAPPLDASPAGHSTSLSPASADVVSVAVRVSSPRLRSSRRRPAT